MVRCVIRVANVVYLFIDTVLIKRFQVYMKKINELKLLSCILILIIYFFKVFLIICTDEYTAVITASCNSYLLLVISIYDFM